jgi:hypothetical protein
MLTSIVLDITNGYAGLAASMNPSSLSTLRKLHFEFFINNESEDPLCGIDAEITCFSKHNVIEEINLTVNIHTDCQCATGDEWGRLDAMFSIGFPRLSKVSLDIRIAVFDSDGIVLQEKLKKLLEEQFPWLSKNSTVMFKFSTEVISYKSSLCPYAAFDLCSSF